MRVFVTGSSGWIGSAVLNDLLDAGHEITALVRSKGGAEALPSDVKSVIGSLADIELLKHSVENAEGVIHTAFNVDFSQFAASSAQDKAAIETFGDVFAGSDRPLVVTSGLGALHSENTFTECDRPGIMPAYPRASEQTAFALAERGVKASVVRPARAVHGIGDRHGFVPMLAKLARQKGVSAYVDDGNNPWPAVHRVDAARVYRLALERGACGEAYHAVAEGVPFKVVAEAIGRQLGVPVRSLVDAEAAEHFNGMKLWLAGRDPVSNNLTREWLGWEPREIGLIDDIDRPGYYSDEVTQPTK